MDLTERCWHLNANSMAAVVSRIRETDLDSLTILVHDLFGNTSVRFRQADDTLSLAVKLPGEGGVASLGGCCVHFRHHPKGNRSNLLAVSNQFEKIEVKSLSRQFRVLFLGPAALTSLTEATQCVTPTEHTPSMSTSDNGTPSSNHSTAMASQTTKTQHQGEQAHLP